jgi:hypothetical protein
MKRKLPVKIAKLIVLFTHEQISDDQYGKLEKWIEKSPTNTLLFEEFLTLLDRPTPAAAFHKSVLQ